MYFLRNTLPKTKNRKRMKHSADDARDKNPGIIKVIGIGQSLRGDDAAGLIAVRLWQATYQDHHSQLDLQVELAELPGIGLLNLLEGIPTAILIDAVHGDAKAGTIHLITEDQLESFSIGSDSAHGWGVAETLSIGRMLMPAALPENLWLIGIEAGNISLGEALSPEVEIALPEVARLIEKLATGE
jgi:hydrogenase maturation protease